MSNDPSSPGNVGSAAHGAEGGEGELARDLNAPMLAIYGAGTILGAGIYVLIGKVAGDAGYWVPLAFLVAALVAGLNGLTYAELSTRSPRAGGPSDYVEKAFHRRWFAVLIGWMIVATGVVSAATITTGFSGYVTHFFDFPEWMVRSALLLVLGVIAAMGAKESAWFMTITTTLGLLGLLFVSYVGFFDPGEGAITSWAGQFDKLPPLGELSVLSGVLTAAFLAVYSFIGFEDIVHMAEEVKQPARSIPFAILVAIAIAAVLYVVVALAATRVLEPSALAESKAPLVDVVKQAGYPQWPLAILSLWIIMNGALAQIIMATRVIYSLGERSGAPSFLASIHSKTQTPLVATTVSVVVALALALFFPLATLASATSFIMLLIFAASNAALIVLERREEEAPFDVPRFVPWIGIVLCLALVVGRFFVSGGGH